MGNDDSLSILHQIGEGPLDGRFGLGVQRRRRVIENEQGTVA